MRIFPLIDDARLLTALSLLVIGCIIVTAALAMWRMHPINRVFALGPYVTEEGMRALLSNWTVVFALGVTALAEAGARVAYWAMRSSYVGSDFANIFGMAEAIFTTWAAAYTVKATVALWRHR